MFIVAAPTRVHNELRSSVSFPPAPPPSLLICEVEKIASLEIEVPPKMKATKVVWGALNEKLIVSYTDGTLRTFDPIDATELQYAQVRGEGGGDSSVLVLPRIRGGRLLGWWVCRGPP